MIADYCSCFPTTFSRRGIIPGLVSPFHLPEERACFRRPRRAAEKRAWCRRRWGLSSRITRLADKISPIVRQVGQQITEGTEAGRHCRTIQNSLSAPSAYHRDCSACIQALGSAFLRTCPALCYSMYIITSQMKVLVCREWWKQGSPWRGQGQ